MKAKVAALSLILLAACGGGGTSQEPTKAPEADIVIPETPTTAEPSAAVESEQPKEEQHPQKEDSLDYLPYLDPNVGGGYQPHGDSPSWEHEERRDGDAEPSDEILKWINIVVVRSINENKMMGGELVKQLAEEMKGMTFDRAMNKYADECQNQDNFSALSKEEKESEYQYLGACIGAAYGYWAMVHGTEETKGNPYQCVNKGFCGYIFDWYK